jgi:hypothetical protein
VTFQSRAVERGSSFLNAGIGCVLLSRSGAKRKKSSLWLANCYFASLARPKMPSGANAFEVSDIQEEETEV